MTGKKYVGQTRRSVEERWDEHVHEARAGERRRNESCRALARAIVKYGPERFTHDVLAIVYTQAAANRAERWWIARLSCRAPHGYNLDAGGGARHVHPETRRMTCLGQQRRRRRMSPEERVAWSTMIRDVWARKSKEERRAILRKASVCITPEQIRARTLKALHHPSNTPEARGERARAAAARKSPEQRSEEQRKRMAARTPEERHASARKAWAHVTIEERQRRGALIRASHLATDPRRRRARAKRASLAAAAKLAAMTPEARQAFFRRCAEAQQRKRIQKMASP